MVNLAERVTAYLADHLPPQGLLGRVILLRVGLLILLCCLCMSILLCRSCFAFLPSPVTPTPTIPQPQATATLGVLVPTPDPTTAARPISTVPPVANLAPPTPPPSAQSTGISAAGITVQRRL
jgi:hypothetical protein